MASRPTWNDAVEKIAMYARSNCKNRSGVLIIRPGQLSLPHDAKQEAELRCHYFKASRLVKCLIPEEDQDCAENKKKNKRPHFLESVVDEAEANKVAEALLKFEDNGQPKFMSRIEKPRKQQGDNPDYLLLGTGKGEIPGTWTAISKVPAKGERLPEDQDGYYVWICEDDQTMSNWMTGGLVVLFLLVTCFPIWPNILKLILWYISCTALIVIILTVIVRWFLFLFVWIFGYEFWVLPNLFDEERTVVDSFKPLYSFEKTGPGQLWWRVAVALGFAGFVYWAYTQPTEFDAFMMSNRQFVDDLYEGNLLSDTSQLARDNIDNPYKIPTIEDLLSDINTEDAEVAEEPERIENEQFHEEEDDDADVDAMLDSLMDDV